MWRASAGHKHLHYHYYHTTVLLAIIWLGYWSLVLLWQQSVQCTPDRPWGAWGGRTWNQSRNRKLPIKGQRLYGPLVGWSIFRTILTYLYLHLRIITFQYIYCNIPCQLLPTQYAECIFLFNIGINTVCHQKGPLAVHENCKFPKPFQGRLGMLVGSPLTQKFWPRLHQPACAIFSYFALQKNSKKCSAGLGCTGWPGP